MIKVSKDEVLIEGTGADILVEYTALTKAYMGVLKDNGFSDRFIDHILKTSVEIAKMSDEEMNRKNREIEVLKMMRDLCK